MNTQVKQTHYPLTSSLRTILTDTTDDYGLPLQTFMNLSVSVPVQDFSGKDDSALDWMRNRFDQPFKLHGKPLFRYDLVKTADDCISQYHNITLISPKHKFKHYTIV
ncbi:hypothetical protein [Candidatus Marithrix sp. Canyon 246]|nr:hypothetical protein [Candidatus Marithrix sp. Canyon 246]